MERAGARENRILAELLAGTVGVASIMILLSQGYPPTSLFVLFPLAAAVLLPPKRTAVVSALAWAGGGAVLFDATDFDSRERLTRLVVLTIVGVASTWLARVRVAREDRLLHMTLVAETAQRAITRALPAATGRVTLAARYLSTARGALVGGDLHEVTTTRYGVRLIVGDVRGKGLEAVRLAAAVLAVFRFESIREPSLAVLAQRLDEVVRIEAEHSRKPEDFVTAVFLEIGDTLDVRFITCGHPGPLVVLPDDAYLLETPTPMPPLGLHTHPTAQKTRWAPGTRALLYTDGLIEARDSRGRFFQVEREADTLRGADLESSLDAVVDHVMAHSGGRLRDDLALVLLECR